MMAFSIPASYSRSTVTGSASVSSPTGDAQVRLSDNTRRNDSLSVPVIWPYPLSSKRMSRDSFPALQLDQAMGVNIPPETIQPQELALMQAAGIKWVRTYVLWEDSEVRPGVYDFKKYDHMMEMLHQAGVRPIITLGCNNTFYGDGVHDPKWSGLQSPAAIQAFARWSAALVNRYRQQGAVWELWNEPNNLYFWLPRPDVKTYIGLAQTVLPQWRAADPTALIIGPATASTPLEYLNFLETCFQHGYLNQVDAVSIHPYTGKNPPEFIEPEVEAVRSLIRRYAPPGKRDMPIIFGEWGYTTAHGTDSLHDGFDEAVKANYTVRQALLSLYYGSPVNIWMGWKDGGSNPTERGDHFGLVSIHDDPKPAYTKVQKMMQALAGLSFKERLSTDSPWDYFLVFFNGRQTRLAAWTCGPDHPAGIPGTERKILLTGEPQYLSA